MPYSNYYKDKIILITGGAGSIGRNLTAYLSKLKAKKIIVLDNLSAAYEWNLPNTSNILFIQGDITNDEDLRRAFHHKPSLVFHLAAFFANQNSVDYPLKCEEVNCKGTLKLLEYCQLAGNIERFVYTNSEGGAYGHDNQMPYSEEQLSLNLSSPYYVSKMAAEAYCNFYQRHYNLPVTCVRLFNSYGPGEVPGQYRNVIPNFIYWAMKGKALPLTGNKAISRDFVFVEETVEGILRAGFFKDTIGTPINIATGQETSIYELAELINHLTNNHAGVIILNQRKWDSRDKIIGSTKKCEKLLKFKPKVSMQKGIELTIQWFKKNWESIEKSAEFPPGINSALDVE